MRSQAAPPTRSGAGKRLLDETVWAHSEETLALEESLQRELLGSPNQVAAVQAAFTKQRARVRRSAVAPACSRQAARRHGRWMCMDSSEVDEHARLGARISGAMMLAGAALGAVSVALPPRASGSDAIVLVLVAMGGVLGVVLLRAGRALPEWLLGVAIATGTALITLATLEGGAVDTGTDDNEMFFVWICLLAFNFLSLRHALGQLALVAAAYALILTDTPLGEAATRWLISMTTLLVAGLLVHHLRSSRDRLVAELSERATTDSLTGLLNRAALEERAVLELARVRRDGAPLSLLLLDVDDLKAVNDCERPSRRRLAPARDRRRVARAHPADRRPGPARRRRVRGAAARRGRRGRAGGRAATGPRPSRSGGDGVDRRCRHAPPAARPSRPSCTPPTRRCTRRSAPAATPCGVGSA